MLLFNFKFTSSKQNVTMGSEQNKRKSTDDDDDYRESKDKKYDHEKRV